MKKVDGIITFSTKSHNFNKHAKSTIIDQITNTSKSKETLTQRLIEREDFWILKLDTLYPKDFNMGKRLLTRNRLSYIRFSSFQLGQYQAEKSPF